MLIQDLGDYIIQHATSSLAGSSQTLASAISALNNSLNSKFFVAPYVGNVSTVTATFPTVNGGQAWLMNVKHYTSETEVTNMMYVIAYMSNVWSFTPINTLSSVGKITGIANSGKSVTITFDKAVYCSVQFITFN